MTNNKNCPLSVDCWTTLLSDKILNEEMKLFLFTNLCIVVVIAFLSGAVASVVAKYPNLPAIFAIFAIIVFLINLCYYYLRAKKLENLKKIKGDIISGDLNTSNKIRECWEKINKIRKKRCEVTLDDLEIDDKIEMMRTHSVNFWYALGGSCIAIGGVVFSGGVVSGGVLIIAGLSMLWGAYQAGTDSNFFVAPSWKLKYLIRNKWLFGSFLLIIVWVVLVWYQVYKA